MKSGLTCAPLLVLLFLAGCAVETSRIAYLDASMPGEEIDLPSPFDEDAPSGEGDLLLFFSHGHGHDKCVFTVEVEGKGQLLKPWSGEVIERGFIPTEHATKDETLAATRVAILRLPVGEYELRALVDDDETAQKVSVEADELQSYVVYYTPIGTVILNMKDIEQYMK